MAAGRAFASREVGGACDVGGLAMLAFLVVVGNAVAALALLFFIGSMFVSSP